ncbi:MAG: SdrD B-like domain-containing protein, partial [Buchananella hordeovulneris]|nr:SdrD B-like domain-containing protein [Buchananella hordeovulneris]
MSTAQRTWRRGITALGAAVAVLLGGIGLTQVGAANAEAVGPHSGVKITSMEIKKKSSTDNAGVDGTVRNNDLVYGSWAWSAKDATPRPVVGDSFTFTLSDAYRLLDTATFDLEVKPGVSVGRCEITSVAAAPRKVTCTFTDGLQAQYDAGESFVHGTGWFVARTTKEVRENSTTFNLNGVESPVANPGGQPIGPIIHSFNSTDVHKATDGVNSTSKTISWNIAFTGDKLSQKFGANVPNPVVFKDALGPGHMYNEELSFQALKTRDRPSIDQRRIYWRSNPSGRFPMVTPADNIGMFRVEVQYNAAKTEATYKIYKESGDWSSDVLYMLSYQTKPTTTNGVINPGLKYENGVSLEGTDVQLSRNTKYVQAAGATAALDPAYGTFKVSKTLGGVASGEIPAGTQVRFNVRYTLPAGWDPAQHPEWQAPATNPFQFPVVIGQASTYFPKNTPFPDGTQIELSEDLLFAQPALPATVQWSNPNLTVNKNTAATATFSITAGKIVEVDAENIASFKPKVSVGDYVWEDGNKDGLQGDVADKPIPNVTLTISRSDGLPVRKVDGTEVTTTETDDAGFYSFDDLEILPDNEVYKVTVTPPAGYAPTLEGPSKGSGANDSSTDVATARRLADGERDDTLDFGFVKLVPGIDIEKYDGDWGGVTFQGDEPVLEGGQPRDLPAGDRDTEDAALVLRGNQSQEVKFTVTNTGTSGLKNVVVKDQTSVGPALASLRCNWGNESFDSVKGADGVLTVTFPADKVLAAKGKIECVGTMPALGEVVKHANNATVEAIPAAGGDKLSDSDPWHAKRPGKVSVGDYVWLDANKDGIQDDGESPIQGVELQLVGPDGNAVTDINGVEVANVTTNAMGKYLFANLPTLADGQKYTVKVVGGVPAGLVPTKAGENNGAGANDSSTAESSSVAALTTDGAEDLTLDFGFMKPAVSVGDYVWFDANKDGLQDESDVPLKDVVLTISRSDNAPVKNSDGVALTAEQLSTKTNNEGKYLFANLEVLTGDAKYVVTVTAPAGYVATTAGVGSDRAKDSSTNTATSGALPNDGDKDLTLDFGFIKPAVSVGDYVWF